MIRNKFARVVATTLAVWLAGCSPTPEVVLEPHATVPVPKMPSPKPKPQPAPTPQFDPNDREKTRKWIGFVATELENAYRPTKQAVDENPLNDELLKAFVAKDLFAYASTLQSVVGKTVAWKFKVDRIETSSVYLWYNDVELTEPYDRRKSETSHVSISVFIENGSTEKQTMPEKCRLFLGKHIQLDFAKQLKPNDFVVVNGTISKVELLYGEKRPPAFVEITLDNVTCVPPKITDSDPVMKPEVGPRRDF